MLLPSHHTHTQETFWFESHPPELPVQHQTFLKYKFIRFAMAFFSSEFQVTPLEVGMVDMDIICLDVRNCIIRITQLKKLLYVYL